MTQPTPHSIADFLGTVHVGSSQCHEQLTLWPLVRSAASPEIPYICLADALASGAARVDEVGDGSVPHVALANRGDVSVLVLFGEEIIGAKQNRVANASFLVAPKSEVVLDVSCVEQGRWSDRPGESFSLGENVISSALRKGMATRVESSRSSGRGFDADQQAVWTGISQRVDSMSNRSKTGAYRDYARSHEKVLKKMARHFQPIEGQVGFVAVRGERVDGVEAVGDPAVYARVHGRLLHAYTIDSVEGACAKSGKAKGVESLAPEDFLRRIASTGYQSGPSLGQGTDLRLGGGELSGCALECGGIVHLMVFPTPILDDHSFDRSGTSSGNGSGIGASGQGRTAASSGGRIRSRRWWGGRS
jgi:hypothetical protein